MFNLQEKLKYKNLFIIIFILCTILAGILFDLTKISIFWKVLHSGEVYTGYSLQQPDSLVMLPAWRDVLDGHFWSSDGMTYEYAKAPYLWMNPPNNLLLFPLILALPSVDYLYLVGYFLVGVLMFIGFYLTINLIIKNKLYSILVSLALVSAHNIFYIIFPTTLEQIKLFIRTFTFLGSPPLQILGNRYESLSVLPGLVPFTFVFLFIYLAIIKTNKLWVVLSGILSGALLYLYPTSAMYVWLSLGLMITGFIFLKNYLVAKRIFWIIMIAVAGSFLNWFNFFKLKLLPWADDVFLVMGGEYGHNLRLGNHLLEYLLYILFSILIWKLAKDREKKKTAIFLIAFLIAPIFLLNIQVVSGYSPYSHAWYVHQFYQGFAMAFFVVFYWLYLELKNRKKKTAKVLIIIGLLAFIILIARAIHANLYSANKFYKGHIIEAEFKDSFKWLNKNTEIDSVVLSPSYATNAYLSIFTHNRVLIPNTISFVGSLEETIDRWIIAHKIFGVSKSDFRDIILKQKGFIFNNYFRDNRIDSWLKRDPDFDKLSKERLLKAVQEVVDKYDNYPTRLEYLLNRYKVDYLYVGVNEIKLAKDNITDFSNLPWLELVYNKDGVLIYKINHNKIDSNIKL